MDNESLSEIVKMHIKECDNRDDRNTKNFDRISNMIKGIWDAHDEMRKIVTSLQIKAALALGGLIVISKAIDLYVAHAGK